MEKSTGKEWMEQAIKHIKNKNFSDALGILEKIIREDPHNIVALTDAAFCHTQMGELSKAVEKYKLLTKFNPDNYECWEQYSFLLFKLGKIAESIKVLTKAARHNADNGWINHQLAFLHFQNQDYPNSLLYADKAINFCKDDNRAQHYDLLKFKAQVYENLDKKKAIEAYFSLINQNNNDPELYDRVASLIIDKFKFSNDLKNLSKISMDYHKATILFRKGKLDEAIELYKDVIKEDRFCYPAYLGIAQAMYEKQFGTKKIKHYKAPEGIDKLFVNYNQLNSNEQNVINASVRPFEPFLEEIISNKSQFIIAPIDVQLTDYPANKHLREKCYLRNISYSTLRGIGGDHAFVGVERLRDLLWVVPNNIKFTPACAAHEYAHLAWCLLKKGIMNDVKELYKQAQKDNSFISNYSSWNVQEYFAEYYAYYTRLITSQAEIPEHDDMIRLLSILRP